MALSVAERVGERLEHIWGEVPGLGSFLDTVDHKRIGKRYIYTSFVFFILGGIEALILRAQLAEPATTLVGPETFNQLFSMHGITMIFFFITPMLFGFGNYFVPLMIGARDMAFPRLNAFGYWVFLFAGIFMNSSFLIGEAPNNGWFNYPPFSSEEFTPGLHADFYTLGLTFLGISTTAGAANFIVTIFKLRAPGMTVSRMPLFCWAILATSFLVIFALPALTVANAQLYLDRAFGFHFFDPARGGNVLLWQHLFWIFGHPDVYIIFLPGAGIVSQIVPVFSRRPMVGYIWVALSTVTIGVIGFGVWVHHMFAVGLPNVAMTFFAAASLVITIPSGVQIFAWTATFIGGRPVYSTALLFVLAFIFLFVVGGVTGVMFAAIPFDQQITDSYFVVAHFHYVLFGGVVFPIFGAFYYWWPKIYGRLLDERLGKISFWLIFIGFNLTFFPMHIVGLLGMPRRIYTYQPGLGWDVYNFVETIGAYVLTAGILVTVVNFFFTQRRGQIAGPDPWRGETLEWATTSPPPDYNFLQIPTVRSREPLWDQPELHQLTERIHDPRRTLAEGHETIGTTVLDAEPETVIPMPHGSYVPIVSAFGIALIFTGLLTRVWGVAVAGGVILLAAMLAWTRSDQQ
ncbi:MAG: cytochrome c oxidase subunit I [Actinomycetota bacterium]|nr:cytochrome c oxidase subunit I [Actinomycetota bacterium]